MNNLDYLEELTDDEDFLDLVLNAHRARLPKTFRERPNHFGIWNEKDFKQRFRFSKETVGFLIEEIADNISAPSDRNHAVSATDMVLLTLRFLATGSFLQVLGDFCGIDKSTACRIVYKVLRAICNLKQQYINMPTTAEEQSIVRQGFYNISRFPRCIGAIDCTHIKIISPGGLNAEIYRNRKSFFSINVQVIGDSNLKIRNIVCRWPGSAHDSNIFRNSRVKYDFENGYYGDNLLVGDSGYANKKYLITPLLNPVTPAENLFNEAQIRTRNPIERLFGVLKRRFPILALGISLHINKVEAVVVACSVLHNIAMIRGEDGIAVDNEEVEHAIELTNNVNNYLNAVPRHIGNVNNVTRYVLINNYFQNLINEH